MLKKASVSPALLALPDSLIQMKQDTDVSDKQVEYV